MFLEFFSTKFSHLATNQMGSTIFYFVLYTTMSSRIFNKLSKIYYSPQGYWKGFVAIKKLAQAAKVSEDMAQNWLMKQALWQVYLPAPRYIPRPKFDVPVPNKVHQADLLYLPHDRPPRSRKTFKCALTVADVASRYKEAEPLTTKEAKGVAAALERIYSRGPLKSPFQRENCSIQILDTLFETRWCERKKAPLRFKCSLSLSTR